MFSKLVLTETNKRDKFQWVLAKAALNRQRKHFIEIFKNISFVDDKRFYTCKDRERYYFDDVKEDSFRQAGQKVKQKCIFYRSD